MAVEPTWFARFEDYLSAVFAFWQSQVAVAFLVERLVERAYPSLWERWVNPWFTQDRRRKAVIWLAIIAFAWGNFRAFDHERREKLSLQDKVTGAPILVGVRYIATRIPSTYSEYPFGLQVVIQTDNPVKAEFAIVFDGPVGRGNARFIGVSSASDIKQGIPSENKNVFYISFGSPQLLPETPLVAYVYSTNAIRVKELAGN